MIKSEYWFKLCKTDEDQLELSFKEYTLNFKFKAGTSRGVLKEKKTFIIKVVHEGRAGFGEAGPLAKLSIDDREDLPQKLSNIATSISKHDLPETREKAYGLALELAGPDWPSIRFGLETAFLNLLSTEEMGVFDNGFILGNAKIPINGLIWMGHMEHMLGQVTTKVKQGFDCIKMKIGSLDFDMECDILEYIRKKYYTSGLTLRVDANGAFKPDEALAKLNRLSRFDLHSVEQPIRAGQVDEMKQLCKATPVPIALDEELIGIYSYDDKMALLKKIMPQFIILKPMLVGGFRSCNEWIGIANQLGIGWWITSALESNIGLSAICQYTYDLGVSMHQGLGTGQLYHNNFPSPLTIEGGNIRYDGDKNWDLKALQL